MGSPKIPGRELSCDQEVLVPADRGAQWGRTNYRPEYDLVAYKLLSTGTQARTKAHCCKALNCSKPTLLLWMKENPSFKAAVEAGLEIGSVNFRNKIAKFAFMPSGKVNNGLIKLLASNVYGIKEDTEPAVVINNNVETNPDQMMKDRGIPVPKMDIEDLEE